jgi:hypothetical protein
MFVKVKGGGFLSLSELDCCINTCKQEMTLVGLTTTPIIQVQTNAMQATSTKEEVSPFIQTK